MHRYIWYINNWWNLCCYKYKLSNSICFASIKNTVFLLSCIFTLGDWELKCVHNLRCIITTYHRAMFDVKTSTSWDHQISQWSISIPLDKHHRLHQTYKHTHTHINKLIQKTFSHQGLKKFSGRHCAFYETDNVTFCSWNIDIQWHTLSNALIFFEDILCIFLSCQHAINNKVSASMCRPPIHMMMLSSESDWMNFPFPAEDTKHDKHLMVAKGNGVKPTRGREISINDNLLLTV